MLPLQVAMAWYLNSSSYSQAKGGRGGRGRRPLLLLPRRTSNWQCASFCNSVSHFCFFGLPLRLAARRSRSKTP
jgi:hypothetical protein